MTKTLHVLVVDDSALMRRQLRTLLEAEPDIRVSIARNGEDALEKCRQDSPDVVTLDINMPVMDGLTCLSHLMNEAPCPVIMVSSLTEKGALATFEALELGAFDYIAKPDGTVSANMQVVADEIIAKVRAAVAQGARPAKTAPPLGAATTPAAQATFIVPSAYQLVVVGVSTGGPGTLEVILSALPADFPVPIVIVQHMPARFTEIFAERLNRACAIDVQEVRSPVTLTPGVAYLARGNADMRVVKRAGVLKAMTLPSSDDYLWHPSVSRLMSSVLEVVPAKQVIAVQLTGMGDDGASEMAAAHRQGALTLAESEQSAVVYGMPRALIDQSGATVVCNKEAVAAQLVEWLSQ